METLGMASVNRKEKNENGGSSEDNKEEEEKKIARFLEEIRDLHILPSMVERFVLSDTWMNWLEVNRGKELRGIDLGDVRHYSDAELCDFTNGYSEDNILGYSVFGNLYKARGYNNRRLVVKDMYISSPFYRSAQETLPRFHADIVFLRNPLIKSHPNFAKLIGYSCERKLVFVFDHDPKAIVHDLLTSDEFGWEARMKVAVDFGRVLKFSHENLIIYGIIHARHIMIDQDSNTKYFDFGLHQRVNNKNEKIESNDIFYPRGYAAPEVNIFRGSKWSMKTDVFAYGILLLNLVCKREDHSFLWREFLEAGNKAIVSESFEMDEHTRSGILGLAMSCVNFDPTARPDMETVVEILERLLGCQNIFWTIDHERSRLIDKNDWLMKNASHLGVFLIFVLYILFKL